MCVLKKPAIDLSTVNTHKFKVCEEVEFDYFYYLFTLAVEALRTTNWN